MTFPPSSHQRTRLLALGLLLALFQSFSLQAQTAELPLKQKKSALLSEESWAICYSGFRTGQHPNRGNGAKNPSDEEMLEDLQILSKAGFKLIRLYDSKENSEATLKLIKSHKLPIKILLGAWLDAEVNNPKCPWKPKPFTSTELAAKKKNNEKEIDNLIRLAKEFPGIVAAVAVGNEALVEWNDHMVPIDSVIAYVKKVKQAIKQPVTVADNYDWWARFGKPLAGHLDFVSVHIYPVWEGKSIAEGISFGTANMEAVRKALPDAQLVITEAGWATVASEFGERASEDIQARYYKELKAWSAKNNITTFFFEAFDEEWKGDPNNPLGAEKHWGIYDIKRKPKKAMR
jgi:exo-beta-1,3-glucanase (GH17 family)